MRDRVRARAHRGRAGRGAGPAPGGVRHPRRAGRTARTRGSRQQGTSPGGRDVGRRPGPGAGELPVVRRLHRPGRQHLDPAGSRPEQRPGMSRTDQTVSAGEIVNAAIAGDEPAFTALAERHRRELHVHCYRMLAPFDEAEDAVQETFLNAWRGRSGFEGGSQFRAWLYRIATNVCLDLLRRKGSARRATGMTSFAEVSWLQPYPDVL